MDRVGWPVAFVICGGGLMFLGGLWWLLSADDPASHPATNAAERELVAQDITPTRTRATPREVARLFLNRSLVMLTLSYGAVGYVQYMFFYWVEYYFRKVLKLSPEASREAAFVITIAMAVGMAVGGVISDGVCRRLGHRWGCRLVAFVGMGLGAGILLARHFDRATRNSSLVVFLWRSVQLVCAKAFFGRRRRP